MLLAKCPARKEVISDADHNLMGFWRSLKGSEVKRCDLTPDKDKVARLAAQRKAGKELKPCDYLYLNKISFGGKMSTFDPGAFEKCRGDKAKRCGVASKDDGKYQERLRNVAVTQGDFRGVLERHDGPNTLTYLDPPYAGTSVEGYCRHGGLQPGEVAAAAKKLRGKVVISYNDSPQVRRLFCRDPKWRCRTIQQDYTLNNRGTHKIVNELLITNFKPGGK